MVFRRAALGLRYRGAHFVFAAALMLAAPALAFTSDEDGYAIDFPEAWQTRPGMMGTSVIGLSPLENKADTFAENVNVVVEAFDRPVDLKRYTQASTQSLGKFLTAYKLVEQKTVTLNGVPATRIIYDHAQGQFQLRAMVYLVVANDHGYVITCTAQRPQFAKYRPAFEHIADTFTVNAPVASPPEED